MTAASTSTETRARHLPEWHLDVLASIYRHRLLSTRQVFQLHGHDASKRRTEQRLASLRERGLVEVARGPFPGYEHRHFVTPLGADVVASSGHSAAHDFVMSPDRAAAAQHLIDVNDVGVALTLAARSSSDPAAFDARSWDHEVVCRYGPRTRDRVVADASAVYVTGHVASWGRWLVELDRGTEAIHRLVDKLVAYRLWSRYEPRDNSGPHQPKLEWKRSWPVLPDVLFVFAGLDDATAERRMQHLADMAHSDPRLHETTTGRRPIRFLATTLGLLQAIGPHGDVVWRLSTLERVPLVAHATPAEGRLARGER